ncbi:unnamed protein product [Schistosoma margrebowiei]|uniref:Uncharacterized protein n=1 Tax=Schistosoma margrebowiei TaxID=48269 RepID=A0A183MXE2_9TREM|nr:unnamed protein product [Schistosoma margrebowiei]
MFYGPSTGVMVNPHTGLLPSTLDPNQMRNQDSQTINYDLLNSSSNLLSLLTHSLQPIQSTAFVTSNPRIPIITNTTDNNNDKNNHLNMYNNTNSNCSSINNSCNQSTAQNKEQQVAEFINTNRANKLQFLLNSMTINSMIQNGETANHSPLINSTTHSLQTDIIRAENDQVEINQHSHSQLPHSYSTYSQHNQPQLQIFGPSTVPSVQQSSITGINYHPPTVSENLVTNGQAHYLITGAPNGTNPSHTTVFANHIQTSPVTLIPEIDYNVRL